jgi:hypothetical protein
VDPDRRSQDESSGGFGGARRPSDFLPGILKEFGTRARRAELRSALEQCLTPQQAELCRVTGFRAGRLTVEVDSAPLYAELSSFRTEDLRQQMNELVTKHKIAQIRFRLSGTRHV